MRVGTNANQERGSGVSNYDRFIYFKGHLVRIVCAVGKRVAVNACQLFGNVHHNTR